MIQELFGSGSTLVGGNGERKPPISIGNGGVILDGAPPTTSPSTPSPLASASASLNSSSSATTMLSGSVTKTAGSLNATGSNGTNQSSSSSESQNLRCPRCDSSNTKFCYYNNYNLTQPRHFCKTCRRYWTKGGALRNVPIGGGCRKNKASTVSSMAKSSTMKFKSLASTGLIGALDHELPSNPFMWASPHSSPILALLRGDPICPNPSPVPIHMTSMKEEVNMFRANIMPESGMASAGGMNSLGLGLDPLNQLSTIGSSSSIWRNSQQHSALHHHQDQAVHQTLQNGYMTGEAQNDNAIQALYQRLKLSTGDYDSERSPAAATSGITMAAAPTSSSSVLESAPMSDLGGGGDQLGYWSNNPNLCWSDLQTSNGAFP
ncbi:hypothetical protein SAY86_031568 [Trapa natans]|uniref:Dof zinc finger protein n=1 Tax=Trapa natans TaxID=22666 RepID=A0AAN7M7T7_TRANT|nr:hypothetical protein SAY86_031568 [Trapa natans]